MQPDAVKDAILQVMPEAEIRLEGADCTFSITVISAQFADMRPVARQQRVLAAFHDALQRGDLHALSVKAFTPQEWEQQQNAPILVGIASP